MIVVIEQPDEWASAYEPNKFSFRYETYVGIFSVYAAGAGTNLRFDTGSAALTSLFSVGMKLKFTFASIDSFHTVISIVGNIVTFDTITPVAISPTSNDVYIITMDKVEVSLYVGQLTIGVTFTKLVDIYVIYREGVHSVDVRGYLQDYFRNIKVPPVVGYDNELYCNYKLVINDGTDELIGTVKNSAYSTIQGLNDTTHVSVGAALRVGAVEMFNANQSIYSRINGNTIETLLI